MITPRRLRERLLTGRPPHQQRAVDLPIPDGLIEVATGPGGVGVVLTVALHRGRGITVAIGEDSAHELSRLLAQAAEASHLNRVAP